jgi:hypothetical protein
MAAGATLQSTPVTSSALLAAVLSQASSGFNGGTIADAVGNYLTWSGVTPMTLLAAPSGQITPG